MYKNLDFNASYNGTVHQKRLEDQLTYLLAQLSSISLITVTVLPVPCRPKCQNMD